MSAGPAPSADWDELVLVGIVARTHGNRGQVIVNPQTDFVDDRFRVGAVLEARLADGTRRQAKVTAARIHQGRPVIGIDGVADMDDAARWAGAELKIDPAEQAPLPTGQYYHHQLIGCAVVTEAGEPVGRVVAVDGQSGQSRLVVDGPRRRHEIPLADEICTVDVDGRRITIRPPDGLLDL